MSPAGISSPCSAPLCCSRAASEIVIYGFCPTWQREVPNRYFGGIEQECRIGLRAVSACDIPGIKMDDYLPRRFSSLAFNDQYSRKGSEGWKK